MPVSTPPPLTETETTPPAPDKPPLRVAVADDHSIMRAVYRTLLEDEPRFALAWSAATLGEARQLVETETPDLLIVDVNMPDGDGLAFVLETMHQMPELKILVISAHEELEYPRLAREYGARGYLTKNSSPADVITAIELIENGLYYFKPFLPADE